MYLVLYFHFCINFIHIDEKILVNFKLRQYIYIFFLYKRIIIRSFIFLIFLRIGQSIHETACVKENDMTNVIIFYPAFEFWKKNQPNSSIMSKGKQW